MNILLINVHSMQNAGDAVLNQVALHQLETAFPGATITLAVNDMEQNVAVGKARMVPSFTWWAKQPRGKWNLPLLAGLLANSLWFGLRRRWGSGQKPFTKQLPWFPLLQAYAEADLVVSCPGNFLYSSGIVGLPLLLAIYTIAYGWLLGKPLYMLPQTIGPLHRHWEHRLVGWVLGKMRWVSLRDKLSQEVAVAGLKLPPTQCRLLPDAAFAFPRTNQQEGRDLLAAYGVDVGEKRPLLGVSLINWGAQNRHFTGQAKYETAVVTALRQFAQHTNGRIILFSQVHGPQAADDDRIPAQHVAQQLADPDAVFIDRPVPPAVLKAAYSCMDFFLGTRLHANIFALTEGVPILAIQYQYKTQGIMEMVGLTEWVLPIEKVDETTLPAALLAAWQARAATRRQLEQVLPPLVAQANKLGQHIREDFDAR